MQVDYLIVGHGLAGACLAFELRSRGQKVAVIDLPAENHSSRVAAGLYNPVTGRKMVKTWNADKLFPALESFYQRVEKEFETKILYQLPIYRPFFSIEEQNEWMGKMADEKFTSIIEKVSAKSEFGDSINDPFGGIWLKSCGYLDIPTLLDTSKSRLQKEGCYFEEEFDEDKLVLSERGNYKDIDFGKIIFANGLSAHNSKYFNWLPFHHLKGEILDLETSLPDAEVVYNRGVFIFNNAQNEIRCGSTYEWREVNLEPTEMGKSEILEKLSNLFRNSVEVKRQRVGIRPSTKDRRPLVGIHPEQKLLGIFNGLGTKGVSIAPYFVVQFCEHLLGGRNLDNEVDINRYFSIYWNDKEVGLDAE